MAQRPSAIALSVCERIMYEEGTGVGIFVGYCSGQTVEQVPTDPISFAVFVALTDGQGTVSAELLIRRPDTLDEIYQHSLPVTFTDPLQEIWCRIPVMECIFPIEGPYQICLLVDGELIAQRRFSIHLTENEP